MGAVTGGGEGSDTVPTLPRVVSIEIHLDNGQVFELRAPEAREYLTILESLWKMTPYPEPQWALKRNPDATTL